MPNDGFDFAHLVSAPTIGGFTAVNGDWQNIRQDASALPPNHAKFYRLNEEGNLLTFAQFAFCLQPVVNVVSVVGAPCKVEVVRAMRDIAVCHLR
jgi:hypothetical protein